MQTYYGKWMPRFYMLVLGVCGLSAFGVWVFAPVLRALRVHGPLLDALNGMTPSGLFGLLVACCCVYRLADSFSVYSIDADWIEKRLMGRAVSFASKSLTACRYNGQRGDYFTLQNNDGQRFRIATPFVSDPQGAFRAALDAHVKPFQKGRKGQKEQPEQPERQDFGAHDRIYNPLRGTSYVAAPFLLLIVGLGLSGLHDPEAFNGSVDSAFLNSLLLDLTAGLGLFGLHCYTWTLTIGSDAVASDTLLRHKRIRYIQVQKVQSHTTSVRGGLVHSTVVEGAGESIAITDAMDGYAALCELLKMRINAHREMRLASAPIVEKSREPMQSIRAIAVLFSGFAAIQAVVFLIPAGLQIACQNELDALGKTVRGKIVDTRTVGRKHPVGYMEYEFAANGQTRRAWDIAAPDYASQISISRVDVGVTYLPDNPAVSRPDNSSARDRAEELFTAGCFFIALVSIVPLIVIICLLIKRPRRGSVP